jgi:hypothetical protein
LVGISQNNYDYWLMGDTFLRNYVSIWDDTNKRLGFVPHSATTATIHNGTLSKNIIPTIPSGLTGDPFIDSFSFDYLQIGVMAGIFSVVTGLFNYSVVQVFFGYSFILPALAHFGIISAQTASEWSDFFLWL